MTADAARCDATSWRHPGPLLVVLVLTLGARVGLAEPGGGGSPPCVSCHVEVARIFSVSPFVRQGHAVEDAPTCVTCHGAEGCRLISAEDLGRLCGRCHGEKRRDIPERATTLLRDLERLRLTRVVVEQALRRQTEASPAMRATQEARLERLRRLVGDQGLEWHRFDLETVEGNTHRALKELGDLYEQVTSP